MSFISTSTALTVHGIAEILAGLAMIFSTQKVFPFAVKNPEELGYLGKSFGIAITALGITGLLSRNSRGNEGVGYGALSYHILITSLSVLTLFKGRNISDAQKRSARFVVVAHGLFSATFLYLALNNFP